MLFWVAGHIFTLVMLNIFMATLIPNLYPVNLQHSSCKHVFSIRVENTGDPDKMVSFFKKGVF